MDKKQQWKRVEVVSVKQVRESSFLYPDRKVSDPASAGNLFRHFFENLDREKFVVASLNTKNEVNCVEVVSVGTLNASVVHPREVFKSAILSSAASIIIAHNHPSESVLPSREDIAITKRIQEAGVIIGIPLIDHIIIGGDNVYSFKEEGKL